MKVSALLATALIFGLELPAAAADNADVPPGDKTPLLRLEAGGPTAFVTALAFSPDGREIADLIGPERVVAAGHPCHGDRRRWERCWPGFNP